MATKDSRALVEMAARLAAKKAMQEPVPRPSKAEISAPPDRQIHAFTLETVTDKLPGGTQITLGKAYRRKTVIKVLYEQGMFTQAQYRALKHYRHHAELVDCSLVRDSLCMESRGGNGGGITVEMLNASDVVRGCEAAAGSLADILRAVVVDDMSLSQWAVHRYGALDECVRKKDKDGNIISEIWRIKPRMKALTIAKQDMQIAAQRVEAELGA